MCGNNRYQYLTRFDPDIPGRGLATPRRSGHHHPESAPGENRTLQSLGPLQARPRIPLAKRKEAELPHRRLPLGQPDGAG
jgi:hypothetical protein